MSTKRDSAELSPLPVYYESDLENRVTLLNAAWDAPATFLFLADKSGVSREWVQTHLDTLPEEYRRWHFVLLTSGSTGRPKMIIGARKRAENLTRVLHVLQQSEPVLEAVVALPLSYCYAFVNQWLWARIHRRRLILTNGLARPDQFVMALEQAANAMLCLVGAQIPMLLLYCRDKQFHGIIRIHFAGGRFPQERLNEIRSLFPNATIFNNYGCAEAMPRLTIRHADEAMVPYHIGWTIPGVEMVSDSDNRLLFKSEYGAVALIDDSGLIKIDNSMWIPTGDLGLQKEDGHWELLGRDGEVFKRHGEKISTPQVLSVVRVNWKEHAECYRETDVRGEEGYVLVLSPVPSDEQVKAILKELSQRYKRSHWPLRVEGVHEMPLLPNGKIDRKALAVMAQKTILWKQVV